MIKTVVKILTFIIAFAAVLPVLLFIIISSGGLNGFIAGTAEKIAGKNLNGKLEIGEIRGNIFSHFSLDGILLTLGGDTVIYCDRIEIGYSPQSLLKKHVDIGDMQIGKLYLHLEQNSDSVWNFMQLIKTSEIKDTASGEFDWTINLKDFRMTNMTATISSAMENQFIPQSFSSEIGLSAFLSGDTIRINLNNFTLLTAKPEFKMTKLSGSVSKIGDMIGWEDIKLQLSRTIAATSGNFSPDENGAANIHLQLNPLAIDEFLVFFPGVELHGNPHMSVSIDGDAADYRFSIDLREGDQTMKIAGSLKNYKSLPEYSAEMSVENLDGSYWTGNEKLTSQISGRLKVAGNGFDIKENNLALAGKFGEVNYAGYRLNDLVFELSKKKDRAAGDLDFSYMGSMRIKFDLQDVFTVPAYDLTGSFRNVDLPRMAGIDSLGAFFNGELNVKGKGISPKTAVLSLSLKSAKSELLKEPIGDFSVIADYEKGGFNFHISDLTTPFFDLESGGRGNIYKTVRIDFELRPHDLSGLSAFFDLPPVSASGGIKGTLEGPVDSLTASGNLSLADILYDSIMVSTLNADYDLNLADSLYMIWVDAGGISSGAMNIRSANLSAEVTGDVISADLNIIVNDSLTARYKGSVEGFEDPLIKIGELGIVYGRSEWTSRGDSASVRLGKEDILINNFSLTSGVQSLGIDGKFSFEGAQDIEALIENVELKSLPLDQFLPFAISGILNFRLNLTGSAEYPSIKSNLSIADPVINKYQAGNISAEASYEKESLSISGGINTADYRLINLSAEVPLHISFKDSIFLLRDDPGFSATVNADSLDLREISEIYPLEGTSYSGTAMANITLSKSLNDPEVKGNLQISRGSVGNKEYGISLEDISLKSYIDSNLIRIEEFSASSGRKGTIDIYGAMSLADSSSAGLTGLALTVRADDFQAMKSDMAELNFDSDLKLTADEGKPRFDGTITVNNSEVNVDYFGSLFSDVKDDPNPPLLIEAMGDTLSEITLADTSKIMFPALPGSEFFKKLTGEAVLNIPGNTWVRGKDMNAELDGTLRVIKSGEAFSLFGELNIRRGFYKLYGKRFDFEQGKVSFTGASELNPELDFGVTYKFRDIERQLKELKLTIKGRLKEPEFEFSLDDRVLEEKDAISYIVFGKSINELSQNERSKVGGNDNVAMNAALSGLASVLKDVLQQSTGLDVLEISGENDWKSTNVTIGKYITNKLYISYEQSFNFDRQSKVVDTEKFMLEYLILRNLILKATNQQINSGFDLIFTKKWK